MSGVIGLKEKQQLVEPELYDRAVILGEYIIENKSTVRACAEHFSKRFGISKSTVHKDISERLPKISPSMYPLVKEILEQNKQERHFRGGLATKHKYEEKRGMAAETSGK